MDVSQNPGFNIYSRKVSLLRVIVQNCFLVRALSIGEKEIEKNGRLFFLIRVVDIFIQRHPFLFMWSIKDYPNGFTVRKSNFM